MHDTANIETRRNMKSVASLVVTRVNVSYSQQVDATQLAEKITAPQSVVDCDVSVFAFLSDVSLHLQHAFIEEMGVDKDKVVQIAKEYSKLAGYDLPLSIA